MIGAATATFISRYIYFGSIAILGKKQLKMAPDKSLIVKPFFASIIMVIFLLAFNYFVGLIWPLAIIEIILGALIYFAVMFLIKGIRKEDFRLVKLLKSP